MSSSTESRDIPKAALYYSPKSVWSALALLCLYEKGYGADEVDLQVVDLASGENYNPTFLRLNPKATVPTLVVPLQKTLSEDVESRYKAITESKAIAEFLDKSRSPQSRTNTTSDAPAPMLAPATIAFMDKTNEIIDLIHSEAANPNHLFFFGACDKEALRKLSVEALPLLKGKAEALSQLLEEAASEKIHVSTKTRQFWTDKKTSVEGVLEIFLLANKPESELSGEEEGKLDGYFTQSKKAWGEIKTVFQKADKAMIGPYVLGDQISIADLHVGVWLARVARLAGVDTEDDGKTVVGKLGLLMVGEDVGTKMGVFWDRLRERMSWKKVYGSGIY